MRCHAGRSLRAGSILPVALSTDSVRVVRAAMAWRQGGCMGMSGFGPRVAALAAAVVVALAAAQLPAAAGAAAAAGATPAAFAPRAAVAAVAAVPAERPGRWRPPVSPFQVLGAFNPPAQDWLPGHRGVDLAAPPGSVVAAPALGTVIFAGMVGGRPVVTIDHGALRTTYEPVVATVPVGHTLVGGQEFGTVGNGGHCEGVCVHWGAIADETYIDPLWLLQGYVPVLKTPW